MKPICFILMPFGRKVDETGRSIDFDRVYHDLIRPGVEAADMEPLRGDEETVGGFVHKPMFERLMLCEYAVAELTTANANVWYELGIRHAVRPCSTVLMFDETARLPFDIAPIRALPYALSADGVPAQVERDRRALSDRLLLCRKPAVDSPTFQLVSDWPMPDLAALRSARFDEDLELARRGREAVQRARQEGAAAIKTFEDSIDVAHADPAVVGGLLRAYRENKAWAAMVALIGRMAPALAGAARTREQLGFALNRMGRQDEAEQVLHDTIAAHGASSETYGLLGRVHKDRWQAAVDAGRVADGHLRRAIAAYLAGFEADWRDPYPGINAVTLMQLAEPPDPRAHELLPVVRYAVQRRLAGRHGDYWDHATLLEIAVLADDRAMARDALADALATRFEAWAPESTARNLALLREARARRDEDVGWIADIEAQLWHAAAADR